MKPRLVLLCAFFVLSPVGASAQWAPDGNVLCAAIGPQADPAVASDGAGGAFVVWADGRSLTYDIYAQRVNAWGVVQWPVPQHGTPIWTGANHQTDPQIISDGANGAIIIWVHQNNNGETDIRAQRIDAAGVLQWGVNGLSLCGEQKDQESPAVVSDGAGGAIVAWQDLRAGSNMVADIYARRITSGGVVQWATEGVAICTAANQQSVPVLVEDGSGGAIIAWLDNRTDGITKDVYAQRVNSAGTVQWAANGILLSTAAGDNVYQAIATDEAGGAIVVWSAVGVDYYTDLYGQRINSAGVVQWAAGGIPICSETGNQLDAQIVSDEDGGAIVTWSDQRDYATTTEDVYAQRIDGFGVAQWTPGGVALCTDGGSNFFARPVADGAGGAVVTWSDTRTSGYDIYAQRITSAGAIQWAADGIPVCAAVEDQFNPVITTDSAGGAIVAWIDYRTATDIYANRVTSGGAIPTGIGSTPALSLTAGNSFPNPFSTEVAIEITLVDDADVNAEIFDVAGRRVRAMDMGRTNAGVTTIRFDGRDQHGRSLPSGMYFCRVQAGEETVTRKIVIQR